MDRRRLRTGELLVGGGGVALLGCTFLPWYDGLESGGLTAWEAFSLVDLLLALTAVTGIAVAVLAATHRAPALPVATSVVLIALAGIVLIVAAYRLLDQPGPNASVDVRLGAYLGLGCLLVITVGAWRSVADEGARAPSEPPIPARPAPPATAPVATRPQSSDPLSQ